MSWRGLYGDRFNLNECVQAEIYYRKSQGNRTDRKTSMCSLGREFFDYFPVHKTILYAAESCYTWSVKYQKWYISKAVINIFDCFFNAIVVRLLMRFLLLISPLFLSLPMFLPFLCCALLSCMCSMCCVLFFCFYFVTLTNPQIHLYFNRQNKNNWKKLGTENRCIVYVFYF